MKPSVWMQRRWPKYALTVAMGGVGIAGAAGCGGMYHHRQHVDDWEVEYSSPISEVRLQTVEQSVNGTRRALSFAEPLFSGDKTALVVSVPEPLYLYVVNLAPDGSKNIIWPSDEPRQVSGSQRIPEGGGWFTLTGETGQEVIAIVGTRDRQALNGAGRQRVLELVERVASSDVTLIQSALPPGFVEAGHATMGVRGHGLSLSGGSIRVASQDPVVMILDIDHRAP